MEVLEKEQVGGGVGEGASRWRCLTEGAAGWRCLTEGAGGWRC